MTDFKTTFNLGDVELKKVDILYDGHFRVNQYDFCHKKFDGSEASSVIREVFYRDPCIAIIFYDPKLDNVVLIEEFRAGAFAYEKSPYSPWLIQIVAGVIDDGENPDDAAHREAKEEAGLTVEKLIPIHQYFSTPGGSNEFVYLYCGIVDSSNAGGIFGMEDENEDIKVHVIKSEQLFSALENNKLSNATTIIAAQWLEKNITRLRAEA